MKSILVLLVLPIFLLLIGCNSSPTNNIEPKSLVLSDDCTDPVEYTYTRQK